MRLHVFTALLLPVTLLCLFATPNNPLDAVRARMDKAATEFKTMTADVTYLTHTDVINDNTTETGTVAMQKVQPGEVRSLIHFLAPDERTVSFQKRLLQIYYPKIKTVQEWNLDKHGEELDQFLMIGFGTSGTTLAKDYDVKVIGIEAVKTPEAIQTVHLRLIPKAVEAKEYVKEFHLWIPESGEPYPVQEKISAPSGDYRLITYKNMKINVPLPAKALQLQLPDGVKTEHPGK